MAEVVMVTTQCTCVCCACCCAVHTEKGRLELKSSPIAMVGLSQFLNNPKSYDNAVEDGCRPIWRDGMLGPAWHCTCSDLRHAIDQQCSVLK